MKLEMLREMACDRRSDSKWLRIRSLKTLSRHIDVLLDIAEQVKQLDRWDQDETAPSDRKALSEALKRLEAIE